MKSSATASRIKLRDTNYIVLFRKYLMAKPHTTSNQRLLVRSASQPILRSNSSLFTSSPCSLLSNALAVGILPRFMKPVLLSYLDMHDALFRC